MNSRRLSPELAHRDPEAFLQETARHIAATTELGAFAWNAALENGTLDPTKVEVRPDHWPSFSSADGRLILGAAPMGNRLRSDLLFEGESLSYEDEVARRLLHELGHSAYFSAQNDPWMNEVARLALDIRRTTPSHGLSALGSLEYYDDPQDKAYEDVAELLTMRMTSRSHSDAYFQLLESPRYRNARDAHGLTTLEDTSYLRDAIEKAVAEGLIVR